ncbi:hypothetical protein O6H91_Y012500 [Diphasiastrum complanatum]|nr:hypothetical protein O6H91_Y012500 [Diphasiastrum complanatum]
MKPGNHCCLFSLAAVSLLLLLITQYFQDSHEQNIVETFSLGSILLSNQSLVSRNRSFALGFFSPDPYPDRKYLGISYFGIPIWTQIWVANRNNPARNGAFLNLSRDGNLFISNPDQTTVWMSGTSGMNITSMLIEDSGNLILRHISGRTIWQSFDHPADSFVPGMKWYVGSNLNSFKSPMNPAQGRFSARMLQTSEIECLWNATTKYWSSGFWNGHSYTGIPEMSYDPRYDVLAFVNDSGRPYLAGNGKKNAQVLWHYTLESDGMTRVRIWDSSNAKWYIIFTQPKNPCDVDHLCGQNGICNSDKIPFCTCPQGFEPVDPTGWSEADWSMGCVANSSSDCSIGDFSILKSTYYDQGSLGVGSVRSYYGHDQAWCQDSCARDCACLGFSFDGGSSNCSLQYGPLFNGRTSPDISQNFFLRVNSSEQSPNNQFLLPKDGKRKNKTAWIIELGVAAGCALLLILFLISQILRGKRITAERHSSVFISGGSEFISWGLNKFSYKELQTATNNFSEKLDAYADSFDFVYRGSLRDQTIVAVRKLHTLKQGDKEFCTEVRTLGMIQHVNLVRLRGFCVDDMHRLLVYENMPNGSLNKLLFRKPEEQQQTVLDWDTRFAIALGTARGILYLHEGCKSCIVHCDIKPENILLDADFCAKVSNFGLAKLMGREFSREITTIRGTRGYLAPEWLSGLPVTAKADVYSFGMTLLEIISGRKILDGNNFNSEKRFFPLWAYQQARLGDFSSLADIKLCGNVNEEQLKMAFLVAVWCIQDDEINRPSMARVLQMLEGTLRVADDPPFPESLRTISR